MALGESVRELARTTDESRSQDNGARALVPIESLLGRNIELAEEELHRRLSSPVLARKISDATLVRLVTELVKLADRRMESTDPRRGRVTTVLAVVQQEGLPRERQISLVLRALEQARHAGEPVDQFEQALRQLAPEQPELLAIEGGDR